MGINFACQTITLEQILKCSFNLKKTDMNVLKILLESREEMSIEDIIKFVDKDRTTIQRAVKNLFEKELIKRRQINLEKGGYTFVYSAKPKSDLRTKVMQIFDSFRDSVENEITHW